MRLVILACCALLTCVAVHAGDDETSVREHSERYVKAILKQDKAALEQLLHKDFDGRGLPDPGYSHRRVDYSEAITHFTATTYRVTRQDEKIESLKVFGDTAIETGRLSGNAGAKGENIFVVEYTRVWLRNGKDWRLVLERR